MADAKYIWELPVASDLNANDRLVCSQNTVPLANQVSLDTLKSFTNKSIVATQGDLYNPGYFHVALLDNSDGNYIALFDHYHPDILEGAKIVKPDGTIFYIRQLSDEVGYASVIVDTFGTDPFDFTDFYISKAPIRNDNGYIVLKAGMSDTIQTKSHVIDVINESGSEPKHYIGREESVSPLYGDLLSTSMSKYRCLESVGFKGYFRCRATAEFLIQVFPPSVAPFHADMIFARSNDKYIGYYIERQGESFRFLESGVYQVVYNFSLRENSGATGGIIDILFAKCISASQINYDNFVAMISVTGLNSQATVASGSFYVVITENDRGDLFNFFCYTYGYPIVIGAKYASYNISEINYATQLEFLKIH